MQQHIHIMGIGGVGMSAIARILSHKGYIVSGCDASTQKSNDQLHREGISVADGHNSSLCSSDDIDMIVHSTAIPSDHHELQLARQRNIPVYSRAAILPYLTHNMFVIAVSGTHGKTTTTALIGHILSCAGLDPTVIVGGHVRTWESNVRIGSSNILVIEADESDKSLLNITPDIALLTNIDYDHTQTYAGLEDTKEVFTQFVNAMNDASQLFICSDDPHLSYMFSADRISGTYGFDSTAPYSCVTYTQHHVTAAVYDQHITIPSILLGHHNIRNILGAIAIADTCYVSRTTIQYALSTFSGIARRCELTHHIHGTPIYDDYAHHPAEIRATISMLLKHGYTHPCIIFQPHRYSRLYSLWSDFIDAFKHLTHGHIIITDIYGAEEKPIANVSARQFATELSNAYPLTSITYVTQPFIPTLQTYIQNNSTYHDVYITLGAGNITHLHAHI